MVLFIICSIIIPLFANRCKFLHKRLLKDLKLIDALWSKMWAIARLTEESYSQMKMKEIYCRTDIR